MWSWTARPDPGTLMDRRCQDAMRLNSHSVQRQSTHQSSILGIEVGSDYGFNSSHGVSPCTSPTACSYFTVDHSSPSDFPAGGTLPSPAESQFLVGKNNCFRAIGASPPLSINWDPQTVPPPREGGNCFSAGRPAVKRSSANFPVECMDFNFSNSLHAPHSPIESELHHRIVSHRGFEMNLSELHPRIASNRGFEMNLAELHPEIVSHRGFELNLSLNCYVQAQLPPPANNGLSRHPRPFFCPMAFDFITPRRHTNSLVSKIQLRHHAAINGTHPAGPAWLSKLRVPEISPASHATKDHGTSDVSLEGDHRSIMSKPGGLTYPINVAGRLTSLPLILMERHGIEGAEPGCTEKSQPTSRHAGCEPPPLFQYSSDGDSYTSEPHTTITKRNSHSRQIPTISMMCNPDLRKA